MAVLLCCLSAPHAIAAQAIRPGEVWPDDRGKHIQAHGGDVVRVGDTFYWYGEDRSQDNDWSKGRYVACYSSPDLVNWTSRGQALKLADPEDLGRDWKLERPKVYYNEKTHAFVMYMHVDDRRYALARVGVAACERPEGPFKYLRSFRPLGEESRDIGQFVDDDGSAYLVFESRPTHGFFIARLSDDYLNVEKKTCFIKAPLEGGALVHYEGLYYVIGSKMTGWKPNSNQYATASRLEGPWSAFKDLAPPEAKTYGSQSAAALKVVGTRKTSVIFIGDVWKPGTQWDARYVWMPLEIGGGRLWLPAPRDWTIDVKTGETSFVK